MEKIKLELYTDYLICNSGFATATGFSAMLDGDISHDQMTRFLCLASTILSGWRQLPWPVLV